MKDEKITDASLQLDNSNEEDRRRIGQYLPQERQRSEPRIREIEKVVEMRPCKICLKSGHLFNKCPYLKSVEEGTQLGPGYTIVCYCCELENCHPGDKAVHRRAFRKLCYFCWMVDDHLDVQCPRLKPKNREQYEKNRLRRIGFFGQSRGFFGRRRTTRKVRMLSHERLSNLSLVK